MSITAKQLADDLVAAYEELEGMFVRGSGMRKGMASAVVHLKANRQLTTLMREAEAQAEKRLDL